jgi:release factor glutamine methyltransferase
MHSNHMNVGTWLKEASKCLKQAGVGTARLDSLIFLEDVVGKERSWLLAHPEANLTDADIKNLDSFIKRRLTHEPLAYIRKKTEFYGQEFYIDNRVLEPRPESETIIDSLKELPFQPPTVIIDIGTGSGTLAVIAKLEFPNAKVIAIDIDKNCLVVARKNARAHKVNVQFLQGDLLKTAPDYALGSRSSVLLCNLPYVPNNFQLNPAALNEPRSAIFGGIDGLEIYRKLFKQCEKLKLAPKFIITEAMPPQHKKLTKIAHSAGFQLVKTDYFIQVFTSS